MQELEQVIIKFQGKVQEYDISQSHNITKEFIVDYLNVGTTDEDEKPISPLLL